MSASSPAVPAVTGLLSPSAHSSWAPFEFPLDWSLDESGHSDSLTMKRGQRRERQTMINKMAIVREPVL
jgi:hypothetical protein